MVALSRQSKFTHFHFRQRKSGAAAIGGILGHRLLRGAEIHWLKFMPVPNARSNITLELKNLELRGNDGVWAAGNYSVTVKDKTIEGHWFRILKRENGAWKIAMEAFARPDAIAP